MRSRRHGIALPLLLWVLVIGSALMTIVVFLALQEQRAGRAGRDLVHVFTRAEAGLADALAPWTPGSLNHALPDDRDSLVTSSGGAPTDEDGDWSATIRRLNQGLFLAAVTARDAAARVQLGRLVRVRPLRLTVTAALTSGGEVRLGGAASVSGQDQPPEGAAECPPPDSGVAGVAAAAVITEASAAITGSPPVISRPAVDSGLEGEELLAFRELASQATVDEGGGVLTTNPATVGTVCRVDEPGNWGDPLSPAAPCGRYMPVVHVGGDLELLPGRGQGILLVDGDLALHGPFLFSGIIMVLGDLSVAAGDTGVRVRGAVFAGSLGRAPQAAAVIEVTYSKCMVDNALLSSGQLIFLRSRSWKQLF